MKRVTLVFAFFVALFLLQSCSVDEMETSRKQTPENLDYADVMKLQDSASNEGFEPPIIKPSK
ncbi:MAG TPA: hypothetical protein VLB74_12565 [Flavobacterium sp.]|uniref:hypothetical protein n=1 Tax=Flavobacterium sp. TaxID=239 RepID=UPI002CC5183D|nr:hypothetical protein [Flavobacterium sp.]HSD15475.1 hypothetical protein [Flavobacterium sp.]